MKIKWVCIFSCCCSVNIQVFLFAGTDMRPLFRIAQLAERSYEI